MSVVSFARRHPLCMVSPVLVWSCRLQVGSQIFSLYLYESEFSLSWKVNCKTHPIKSIVLIMKPSVGLTVVISSFMIFFTMVVLPALSRPLVHR